MIDAELEVGTFLLITGRTIERNLANFLQGPKRHKSSFQSTACRLLLISLDLLFGQTKLSTKHNLFLETEKSWTHSNGALRPDKLATQNSKMGDYNLEGCFICWHIARRLKLQKYV